ncbi:hypothetical protein SAMN06297387_102200 [Streptomyces zhaozhouensis]|uniref:Uncharacterized protein n=1 Tax=Streptomyces zhaozhouensis TaxID=1300267 RepID=A0A286DPL9_9ACTN|nr:hypothetical protein [Streptomyces zhaozhouensis]SOD60647.1 hypothetical protein SAMN06297387_102200 [Streptomyces zhaozhouensis]
MDRGWEVDTSAGFARRLGVSAAETGDSKDHNGCPDIWELENGDVAVIGRDHTETYRARLPEGVAVASDERLVIIPGRMMRLAKKDIPDD